MDARKYLSQLEVLRIKIDHKRRQLKEKEYMTFWGGSITGDAGAVQSSRRLNAPYENKAIECADLAVEIENSIMEYRRTVNEIVNTIHKIDQTKQLENVRNKHLYIDVIYRKWVIGNTLEEISVDTYRSFDHVRHIYCRGMKAMQEVLNERDKQRCGDNTEGSTEKKQ